MGFPQYINRRPVQGYAHVSMGSGAILVIEWCIRRTRMCPIAASMFVQPVKEAPKENENVQPRST